MVVAFGGGIVNDMAGFLAAIFLRGVQVLQPASQAAHRGTRQTSSLRNLCMLHS